MHIPTPIQALTAAAVIAWLAGCSGGGPSAIAPNPASPQGGAHSLMGSAPSGINPIGLLKVNARTGHHFENYDSCPATGPIEYVSDTSNNVIYVYAGKFVGQAPCGQITSGVNIPTGLYVKSATHDLYVANYGVSNILVFHKGQTTPYNAYTDPTSQFPMSVTVANDGTVIDINYRQAIRSGENGSISTWVGGPSGGTFVGNFSLASAHYGDSVTAHSGKVYFDDLDPNTGAGALWSVSCPAGACGTQTQVAGVSFTGSGGMVFDGTGDLVVNDRVGHSTDIFELPNPTPTTISLPGYNPTGLAISKSDHRFFFADSVHNVAKEYVYPSGTLVGTIKGYSGGSMFGVAVDPGHN